MTLTFAEGFARYGWRSGEILDVSASADPAQNSATQSVTHRRNPLDFVRDSTMTPVLMQILYQTEILPIRGVPVNQNGAKWIVAANSRVTLALA